MTIVEPNPTDSTTLLPPTVAQIEGWSRVDFTGLDQPFTDADLQVRIDRSVAELTAITGRLFDDTMPGPLVSIAQEAVQLRVEQMAYQEQEDYAETVSDDLIQSFTAGNYSETRKSPRDRYTGMTTGLPEINPNPWLNRDIWLLCTDDMRAYWTETLLGQGQAALIPSFEVTEVDWDNYGGLYPYSYGVGAFHSPLIGLDTWGA